MVMDLFALTLSKKSLSIHVSFIVPLLRFLIVSFLLFSFSSSLLLIGEASTISTTPRPCIHDHFSALIQLKQGFHLDKYSTSKLSSWNYNDSDCCSWEGIACDNATGHVISLDISSLEIKGQIDFESLFRLHSLQELNLADNDFDPSPLSSGFDQLKNLTHLDLSWLELYGQIPFDISRLTNLVTLNLSYNDGLKLENPSIDIIVQNLSSLRALHLDGINISAHGTKWSQAISSALPRLRVLSLRSCNLAGPLPSSLVNLTNLEELYLSSNNFIGSIPLSYASEFRNLRVLSLRYTSLSGTLPASLFSLSSLQELYLDNNQFSGRVGEFHNASSSPLIYVDLNSNNLQGHIPRSIFQLPMIKVLILSSNNFSGVVELDIFQNHRHLRYLSLADNRLSVKDSDRNSTDIFPYQIEYLSLRSCNISKFPGILKNQEDIFLLDLSNNRINGEIPKWIWKERLEYLNLSRNTLMGSLPPLLHLSLKSLVYLDLSSNMLQGSVPIPPPSILFFLVKNNNFSGEIPSLFCDATSLTVLDLSENNFSGQIPQCFGKVSDVLNVLNLRGNAFSGNLLLTFKKRCSLQTLDLSENQLKGRIPRTLANCEMLELLNLGNNQMHDTFPLWLETLSELRVLILRSNNFYGPLRFSAANHVTFPLLQIIDLSSNNFTGTLPPILLQRCKPMIEEGISKPQLLENIFQINFEHTSFYQDSVTLVTKALKMKLVKILTDFTLIDLSNNNFQGVIPESFGNLRLLRGLNMSHNNFIGRIPASFQNMSVLESLDLSQNKLTGEIPWQLTELTFLEVLNLSENLFIGKIPQSRQFLTFTNESFQGNLDLCGRPLSKECGEANVIVPLEESELEGKINWQSMWIGFGAGNGVGLGIFFWTIALWKNGMIKFKRFTDRVIVLLFRS